MGRSRISPTSSAAAYRSPSTSCPPFYIDILTTAGRNIPPNILNIIISDLVSPVYNNGLTGFAFSDMQNVKIASSDFPTAGNLLPGGRLAITLGPVIVLRSDFYNALTDPANAGITTNDLLNQPVANVLCTGEPQWDARQAPTFSTVSTS